MENQNKSELAVEKQEKTEDKQHSNYFNYIIQSLKNPDTILDQGFKGQHQFGLINMIVFIGLILLTSLIGIIQYLDALEWFGFGDYFDYFSRAIAYTIAIAILLPVFINVSAKNGSKYHINYFFEKLGAFFILPSILLIASIPLELLDVTIYSWLSSLATTFLYMGVFMTSYLYVARNNIKVAVLFLAGFYIVYRIIYLLF